MADKTMFVTTLASAVKENLIKKYGLKRGAVEDFVQRLAENKKFVSPDTIIDSENYQPVAYRSWIDALLAKSSLSSKVANSGSLTINKLTTQIDNLDIEKYENLMYSLIIMDEYFQNHKQDFDDFRQIYNDFATKETTPKFGTGKKEISVPNKEFLSSLSVVLDDHNSKYIDLIKEGMLLGAKSTDDSGTLPVETINQSSSHLSYTEAQNVVKGISQVRNAVAGRYIAGPVLEDTIIKNPTDLKRKNRKFIEQILSVEDDELSSFEDFAVNRSNIMQNVFDKVSSSNLFMFDKSFKQLDETERKTFERQVFSKIVDKAVKNGAFLEIDDRDFVSKMALAAEDKEVRSMFAQGLLSCARLDNDGSPIKYNPNDELDKRIVGYGQINCKGILIPVTDLPISPDVKKEQLQGKTGDEIARIIATNGCKLDMSDKEFVAYKNRLAKELNNSEIKEIKREDVLVGKNDISLEFGQLAIADEIKIEKKSSKPKEYSFAKDPIYQQTFQQAYDDMKAYVPIINILGQLTSSVIENLSQEEQQEETATVEQQDQEATADQDQVVEIPQEQQEETKDNTADEGGTADIEEKSDGQEQILEITTAEQQEEVKEDVSDKVESEETDEKVVTEEISEEIVDENQSDAEEQEEETATVEQQDQEVTADQEQVVEIPQEQQEETKDVKVMDESALRKRNVTKFLNDFNKIDALEHALQDYKRSDERRKQINKELKKTNKKLDKDAEKLDAEGWKEATERYDTQKRMDTKCVETAQKYAKEIQKLNEKLDVAKNKSKSTKKVRQVENEQSMEM